TLAAGGPIVLLDAKALTDLARSPQDLRDHSLFGTFDTRDVTRVQIQRKDQTLVLERKGEEDWQLTAPKQGKARGGRVNDLRGAVPNTKWKDLVAEQGWEPSKYGLDVPGTTVTLSGKDGKPLAAVAVGTRDKAEAYVRVPEQPALYTVDSKSLGELPATADD